jgi:uncharacterized alkaline shock family protein YloU
MQTVIAFVGPSGTGKSHHAMELAHDLNAEIIIDDGLLITISGRIAGGTSSKLQPTKIGAFKTALFMDDHHYNEAKKIINKINPKVILILGTSDKMVERIAKRLDLDCISKYINISDILDINQIRTANYFRKQLGKHIIPAPTIEVSRTFPNTLIESIHTFLKKHYKTQKQKMVEQTVIRPPFSYLGRITITNRAIEDLVRGTLQDYKEIEKINSIKIHFENGNIILSMHIELTYGVKIFPYIQNAQRMLKENIEKYTDFNIISLNITVNHLVLKNKFLKGSEHTVIRQNMQPSYILTE